MYSDAFTLADDSDTNTTNTEYYVTTSDIFNNTDHTNNVGNKNLTI